MGITVLVVAVVILVAVAGSYVWTEVMWYQSVGFGQVFATEIVSKTGLFVVGTLLVAALVASSMIIGYRSRPIYAPTTERQQALDRYREMIEPLRRAATIGAPIILGLFAGGAAASQWKTVLLWLNRQPFGSTDPTFDMDIGFFVFTLPWLQFIESFLTMAMVLALLAAAFTHYVYGGLQLGGRESRVTRAARVHLSVLAAAFVLLRALGYWLDRYQLSVNDSQRITGLTYTDQTAVLPTKAILALAAIICAGLFIATIWTSSWRLPIISVALLLVTSLVFGGIYPAAVQSLRVRPSEQALEAPYIDKNIKATRAAYGLDRILSSEYRATTTATAGQLRADAATIPGIRILDPLIVSPTFKQMQGLRAYYEFPDSLDVDRYPIEGRSQDTVIAVRELDLLGVPQRNWVNDHTVYTHGFGVVAAYGNRRSADGEPVFATRNIPPVGPLMPFEPRIYFGEKSTSYSIVGAAQGQPDRELDYQSEQGESRTTYRGGGGVAMDNVLRRAAYAAKYRELKLMLSEQVSDDSRMLDYRTPRERVERAAPWLTLDGNAYPAVADGRVTWIIDGYTTSANYPYSRLQALDRATRDAVTTRSTSVTQGQAEQVNYIRNSVKATVDAYDGSIRLFAWDDQDPVLKAWSSAFEGSIRPMSELSGGLMSHMRYPEDLFKMQRELLAKYHVTDPGSFYSGGDYWKVPVDPTADDRTSQPPYYLSIKMPGQPQPSFSLTTSFSPVGDDRPFLTGFLAVDADAGSEKGKRRAGYGVMRLLRLPSSTNVPGPLQVQNQIGTSNANSRDFPTTLNNFLNINNQSGSRVLRGNLLTLPVGGGLLYVQPIYVRPAAATSYPLMRAVVVAFGTRLAWGNTLDGALDQLFGGDAGVGATASEPTPSTPVPPGQRPPATAPTAAAELKTVIAEIQRQYAAGREALKAENWTEYGKAQRALEKAIARAVELQPSGVVSVTPGT
ncbi:MAG TPA: UPF0182 family protein [Dermatophilaceae bacterium]|nr:UPF0182 family protein [Dermatophilaceae bacterium]